MMRKRDDEKGAVKLHSSDSQEFRVALDAIEQCQTIKNLIEDSGTESAIPLPNVHSTELARVIVYCEHLASVADLEKGGDNSDDPSPGQEVITRIRKTFTDDFIIDLSQEDVFQLIMAANYLNVKPLLDLLCGHVAKMIKGLSTEEIRQEFKIKNDFTPEEEEEVRRENQWAFD